MESVTVFAKPCELGSVKVCVLVSGSAYESGSDLEFAMVYEFQQRVHPSI